MEKTERILAIYQEEYGKLKTEQANRIGFRDNLIYVTLTVVGSVLAFVLSDKAASETILAIPWVCFILGWTYMVNDQKISAIGKYLRHDWKQRVAQYLGPIDPLLGWENYHRTDKRRVQRKVFQFSVDVITFVVPGMLSLIQYCFYNKVTWNAMIVVILISEVLLLVTLLIKFVQFADFSKVAAAEEPVQSAVEGSA